jgi:hypothetical protein
MLKPFAVCLIILSSDDSKHKVRLLLPPLPLPPLLPLLLLLLLHRWLPLLMLLLLHKWLQRLTPGMIMTIIKQTKQSVVDDEQQSGTTLSTKNKKSTKKLVSSSLPIIMWTIGSQYASFALSSLFWHSTMVNRLGTAYYNDI